MPVRKLAKKVVDSFNGADPHGLAMFDVDENAEADVGGAYSVHIPNQTLMSLTGRLCV